jgi:hypothetical protein
MKVIEIVENNFQVTLQLLQSCKIFTKTLPVSNELKLLLSILSLGVKLRMSGEKQLTLINIILN